MTAITLVLAFGMVWVSTRSKFVPYVVEVDKLGYAIGAPSALTQRKAARSMLSSDRRVAIGSVEDSQSARQFFTLTFSHPVNA